MKTLNLEKVFNWLDKADVPQTGKNGSDMSVAQKQLLIKLIFEELTELAQALGQDAIEQLTVSSRKAVVDLTNDLPKEGEMDRVEVADALIDLFYVTANGLWFSGIEDKTTELFEEVCKSNDSKFCKSYDEAEESGKQAIEKEKAITYTITSKEDVFIVKNEVGKIMKSYLFKTPNLKEIL